MFPKFMPFTKKNKILTRKKNVLKKTQNLNMKELELRILELQDRLKDQSKILEWGDYNRELEILEKKIKREKLKQFLYE